MFGRRRSLRRSELDWTLAAEFTVPVPEMWIALHSVGLRASIPKGYETSCWFAATALTPTGQAARPTIPPKIDPRRTGSDLEEPGSP